MTILDIRELLAGKRGHWIPLRLPGAAVAGRNEGQFHPEVLDCCEGANLPLSQDHQVHRDGLHAPGGGWPAHHAPQLWRDQIPHQAIDDATAFLRGDLREVQTARRAELGADARLGDFLEGNALVVLDPGSLEDVPANAFAFAIRVGCDVDLQSFLLQLLQPCNGFFLAREDLVVRFVILAHADGEHLRILAVNGEVSDVAGCRLDLPGHVGTNRG